MNCIRGIVLALGFFLPLQSYAAQQWSTCQTIVGVSNYMAFNNDNLFILSMSPGVIGCAFNSFPGAIGIEVGQFGVTSSNINSFLANSLTAYATGHQVMVYYDTTSCFGIIIANGGYEGQCP